MQAAVVIEQVEAEQVEAPLPRPPPVCPSAALHVFCHPPWCTPLAPPCRRPPRAVGLCEGRPRAAAWGAPSHLGHRPHGVFPTPCPSWLGPPPVSHPRAMDTAESSCWSTCKPPYSGEVGHVSGVMTPSGHPGPLPFSSVVGVSACWLVGRLPTPWREPTCCGSAVHRALNIPHHRPTGAGRHGTWIKRRPRG